MLEGLIFMEKSDTNDSEKFKISIWLKNHAVLTHSAITLFAIFFPPLLAGLFFYTNKVPEESLTDVIKRTDCQLLVLFGWFVELAVYYVNKKVKDHKGFCETILRQHIDHCSKVEDEIYKKNLVFYPAMEAFDTNHTCVLEDMLSINHDSSLSSSHAGGPQDILLCLDSTDPSQWWSNNMIGYLAIQSRWASLGNVRKVCRIFVWDKKELQSRAGSKLLALHRILGCTTIVCPSKYYNSIVKTKKNKREFLIWDEDDAIGIKNSQLGSSAVQYYGYESFWYIADGEQERNKTTKGKTIKFHGIDIVERAKTFRDIYQRIVSDKRVLNIEATNVRGINGEIEAFAEKID